MTDTTKNTNEAAVVADLDLPPLPEPDDVDNVRWAYNADSVREIQRAAYELGKDRAAVSAATKPAAAPADWRETVEALEEAYSADSALVWMDRAAKIIRGLAAAPLLQDKAAPAPTAEEVRSKAIAECLAECEAVRESGCESTAGAVECINAISSLKASANDVREGA